MKLKDQLIEIFKEVLEGKRYFSHKYFGEHLDALLTNEYKEGVKKGYQEGFSGGYSKGFEEGSKKGYNKRVNEENDGGW